MNPDAIIHAAPILEREGVQSRLQLQGEPHSSSRPVKDNQERITSRLNFFGPSETSERFTEQGVVLLHKLHPFTIAHQLLEFCGTDDVGEQDGLECKSGFAR